MPVRPEVVLFLLISQWAVAALAGLVLGAVRWRRGSPGGRALTVAAGLLVGVPAGLAALTAAGQFGLYDPGQIKVDDDLVGPVLLAASVVPVWLCGSAAARAFRAVEEAERDRWGVTP